MKAAALASWMLAVLLCEVGCASGGVEVAPAPTPVGTPTASSSEATPPDFSRQILVMLQSGPESFRSKVIHDLASVYALKPVYSWPIPSLGEHCVVFEAPARRSPIEVAEKLAADRRVILAQPIHLFRALGSAYNDPYAHLQVGLEPLALASAHALSTGKGVRVAVVDTGIDLSHPDLAGRVRSASSFISWGAAAFTGDVHGTAVAGVIAADANNGLGIVGVAPQAELLALKACWQDSPDSRQAVCNSYTLAQALDAALAQGAQVINLSLGGPSDPLLARLIATALERRITVVAAHPESGEAFPASLPGVLAVEASGKAIEAAGATAKPATAAYLTAPGIDVLTTAPRASYDFFSGSSIAAAQVAGVVALLLQRRESLSPAEVRALLAETSGPGGATGPNTPGGVDACAALARLLGLESSRCEKPKSP